MSSVVLQYVFWVLMALPLFALGIFFFMGAATNILDRYRADAKKKQQKEMQEKRRQEFEESYRRRRGGGN